MNRFHKELAADLAGNFRFHDRALWGEDGPALEYPEDKNLILAEFEGPPENEAPDCAARYDLMTQARTVGEMKGLLNAHQVECLVCSFGLGGNALDCLVDCTDIGECCGGEAA